MRTHQLVLDWLVAALDAGELSVGDRLPSERTLAERIGVSRASVREGVRILEAMGMVRAGVGSGPEAGTILTANPAAALSSALRLHIASSHLPVEDVVETRVMLETWIGAHARPDAPALDEAARLLEEMDAHAADAAAFLELDARFHVALAEATGNSLVSAMMSSLRAAIRGYTLARARTLPDWDATARRLRAEHRAVLAAIRSGRGPEAGALLAGHIRGYQREAEPAGAVGTAEPQAGEERNITHGAGSHLRGR